MSISNDVFDAVQGRIALLNNDTSYSRGMLAKLRRAAGKNPIDTPDVWDITMVAGVTCEVDGKPTKQFWAIHIALTLYALHKQASSSVHTYGVSFGSALAKLGSVGSVLNKFNKLVLSRDIQVTANYAGSLVRLLKGADIGFDYAQFAKDLYNLQWPEGYKSIRLKWGTDFHTPKTTAAKK